jgi:thiamine pyrophosphokinase
VVSVTLFSGSHFIIHVAKLKICADGGGNQLYDFAKANGNLQNKAWLPDYVIGDLDSLKDGVRQYYEEMVNFVCNMKQSFQFSFRV